MACCVPLFPYKDLKTSLFGVPKIPPLRDEWEKVLDVLKLILKYAVTTSRKRM